MPDLTTRARREAMDSEDFAALDFLVGAIAERVSVSGVGVLMLQRTVFAAGDRCAEKQLGSCSDKVETPSNPRAPNPRPGAAKQGQTDSAVLVCSRVSLAQPWLSASPTAIDPGPSRTIRNSACVMSPQSHEIYFLSVQLPPPSPPSCSLPSTPSTPSSRARISPRYGILSFHVKFTALTNTCLLISLSP